MSRVANAPISIPSGVEVKLNQNLMVIKGKLGELSFNLRDDVNVEIDASTIQVKWDSNSK